MPSIWATSAGGRGNSRRSSFAKRRRCKEMRGSSSDLPESPTTVLSPESSTSSSSSVTSFELNTRYLKNSANSREFEVEGAGCFEPINSLTWTVSIDKPSDLLVQVNEISFHLHKLPILSRSALLSRLAAEYCSDSREKACINLGSIPGGAEAFALAAKFCYSLDVELSSANVAELRCASEYLEMTEELEEGNVSSKAEAYLSSVVLNSWQESIVVLQSCEHLLPWAEDLNIAQRCSESIARKANCDVEYNWASSSACREISLLTSYCLEKVVSAMRHIAGSTNVDVLVGGTLELHAQKWLPGVFKSSSVENSPSTTVPSTRRNSPTRTSSNASSPVSELLSSRIRNLELHGAAASRGTSNTAIPHIIAEQNKNRFIIETIVGMLPPQKDSVACSFLLQMLRAANMFNCSADCRADLEKKAGLQLDQASLSDLLIPSFCHTSEYLYDVDLVRRLLEHFLALEHGLAGARLKSKFVNKKLLGSLFVGSSASTKQAQLVAPNARVKLVAKLLDSYLAEVARDSKLPLAKFQSLAEAVPVSSRVSDDGLYRAIDTYLKIHPGLTEHEKKKLCRILDCHRFSIAACMHAAQNERLPLRIVVQVLFGEQLKLRDAITGISQSIQEDRRATHDASAGFQLRQCHDVHEDYYDESPDSMGSQRAMLETTNQMEIKALQHELETMSLKYSKLEKHHFTMMEQMEKLSRPRRNSASSWTPWKKSPSRGERFEESTMKGDSTLTISEKARVNKCQRLRNSIS